MTMVVYFFPPASAVPLYSIFDNDIDSVYTMTKSVCTGGETIARIAAID